ncbi:MAG: hypothetical protein IJJ15_00725 [Ruminococcus sp.]|nr:hypothetical protein [Ruminococcus sp.]
MLTKKAVSLILCIAMLLTVAILPATFVSAAGVDAESSANSGTDYGLATKIEDGNILHAFNWKMQDIKEHAAEIAAAGYTTVQISPIQKSKEASNIGSYATDWWAYYQPTDFTVGNALGTQADVASMTSTLHSYGIKVIADVVTNHTTDFNYDTKAERTAAWNAMSDTVKGFYRHNTWESNTTANDNNRTNMTTLDVGGLKDINTENKSYQNYLITNLFNPLSNAGVDGFRFDAAKHIATPDDSPSSDYWPTITNAIKSKNSNAFIYGEVLSLAGKLPVSAYTKYMRVTDYAYGDTVRAALNSNNASSLANYGYTGSQKNQNVLWVESHDTYCDKKSFSLSKQKQIVGWAVVGARKDAPALFFVRPLHENKAPDSKGHLPYDELMGYYGSADTWQNKAVVEVNKFKNAFAGQSENVSSSGSLFFVQRGTSGMVIANLSASSASVNQSCTLASGSYVDQVSGNTFNVSGGKITGNIGSTGVAVIYNKTAQNSAPEVSVTLDGEKVYSGVTAAYANTTAKLVVTVKNATSATVKFNNLSERTATLNGSTTFNLNTSVANGKSIPFTVTAKNGSKTTSTTYTIVKDTNTGSRRVYFDNTATQWPSPEVFCKNSESATGSFSNSIKMTKQSGNIWYADVPSGTTYVKFNYGMIPSTGLHIGHNFAKCGGYCGPTLPPTMIYDYGTDANYYDNLRTKGGFHLIGTMICQNLHMVPYNYTAGTLKDTDVTGGGSTTPTTPQPTTAPPTQPPTQPSTQKPTTQPSTETDKLILGDTDRDGKVSVLDATKIQKRLASLVPEFNADTKRCADVDGDGVVSVLDATYIQKYLASMSVPYDIGKVLDNSQPATSAPQPSTDAPEPYTDAPEPTSGGGTITPSKLSNKWVAMVYCEEYSTDPASRTKQFDLDEYGRLTYEFPGDSYVFCRNYDSGVQYCTDGWAGFVNPVTLVNQNSLSDEANFNKMYVPAGTHTLCLQYDKSSDTATLSYDMVDPAGPVVNPTSGGDNPPVPVGDDLVFEPGEASVANPAWFGWFWNTGSEGQWIKGTEDSSGNIIFANGMSFGNVTVVRMPSGSATADWNTMWNQSEDIAIQQGTLYFTGWGSSNKFLIGWK